jgi:type I restriction-modification system DNA methylase subunit
MPSKTETTYTCSICKMIDENTSGTGPCQLSHINNHHKSSIHKKNCEITRLNLRMKTMDDILIDYPEYLDDTNKFENQNKLIEQIIKERSIVKTVIDKVEKPILNIQMNSNISNKEALKEKIHEIHNFLRNNGAGYGMAALKVFNIFYGLKRIEENKLFDKLDLSEECKFSYLLEKSKGDDDELYNIVYNRVLGSLSESKLRYFLFYEIPTNMKGKIFSHLINELDKLTEIEKSSGEQLTGKIYEYFIGRDKQAISELGAYFTNRLIVEYIYKQLNLEREADGSIGTMVDMFGGSGGFTTGYINWMKEKYPDIDWSSEINKIHHYDMNEDVIKSAALEFFCITGEVPNMQHLQYKNSFADEFNDQQFKYCITNPPYGGDKNKKSDAENKREKIKKYIKEEFKTLTDKDIIKRRNEQLKHIDNLNKLEKKRQDEQKVTLDKSSKRIKKFAKKYGLKGNDKEAVSLMLMMDMVEEGGVGCGVLKEGVFFNGTYKNIRKCLLENFNVTKIISIPSDQFENTSTKTSIVIFENTEEKTSSVQFYDLSCVKFDKDKIEEIDGHIVLTENQGDVKGVEDKLVSVANVQDILNHKDISLIGKVYNKVEIVPGDGYEIIRLGDICNLTGRGHYTSIGNKEGKYRFYNSSQNSKLYVDFCDIEELSIILGQGGAFNIHIDRNFTPSKHVCVLQLNEKNDDLLNFIYAMIPLIKDKLIVNGSVLGWLNNANIKSLKIPIPKDKQTMIKWVNKLSDPKKWYTERIKELEEQVKQDIQNIIDTNECDDIKLGNIIDRYNNGKTNSTEITNTGEYPFYAAKSSNPSGTNKDYDFDGKDYILFAKSGGSSNNKCSETLGIGKFWFVTGKIAANVAMIKFINNYKYCNNNYLKYILKLSLFDIQKLAIYTTGNGNIPMDEFLKEFKIKIPKNKQLIQDMEPPFQELEQLHVDVKNADKKYKDLIEELKNEAIKQ